MPGWLATALQRVGARLWTGLVLSLIGLAVFWDLLYGLSVRASAVAAIFGIALAAGLFWALAKPRSEPGDNREN